MKSKAVMLLALSASPLMAAANLSGGTTYVQNFNTLPTAAGTTWLNGSTLPNWHLYRSTTDSPTVSPAPVVVNDNDPVTVWTAGLYSLGPVGDSDRALGSAPTGTVGTFSHIVILRNDTTSPVQITNVKYKVENWRENTTAGIVETIAFATRVAASEATLTSGLAVGYTDIPALAATIPHSGIAAEVNNPSLDVTVNAAPPSTILVPAGSFIALRWLNANEGGSDAYLGIDDVEITYAQVSTALTATTANIARQSQGTANPADDTMSFTANITGLGAVSPAGWVRVSAPAGTAGPASGPYGTAVSFTNVPVNAATQTFVFQDAATASAQRTVTITVPPPPAELTATSGPLKVTFDTPALGAAAFTRDFDDPTSDLGWTSGLPGAPANTTNGVNARLADPATNHYLRINNSRLTAANQFTTEPVRISGMPSVNVAISATAYATSATGFEDAAEAPTIANSDRIQCFVQVSANGTTWTQIGAPLIDPNTTGPALFEAFKLIDTLGGNETGINHNEDIANLTTSLPDPIPFATTRRVSFVPGANQFARVVLLGGNDSASENILFDNITFDIPRNVVAATASAFTYNNQGNNNPADDTYSFTAVVTNQDPLRTQGWTSDVIAEGAPVTGTYGGTGKVLGPFPVSDSPKSIVFSDVSDPSVTFTLTVERPVATIAATVALVSRDEGATSAYGDDTWTVRATVTSANASTGWAESTTGLNGVYATALDFGPFPVSDGAQTFNFTDLGDAALQTVAITLEPPTRPIVGVANFGGGDVEVPNILSTPAGSLAWRAGAEPYTSEQLNGGGTVPHELRSAVVDLTGAGGPVTFTAQMEARDTSTGTNFETADTFRIDIELVTPGGGVTTIPLITTGATGQDKGNGAASAGANGAPNGVLNGFTGVASTGVTVIQNYDANRERDEFNTAGEDSVAGAVGTFQWSYQIPSGVVGVSMVVKALNNAASEAFLVKNVRFSTAGVPQVDTDGDGSSDADELTAGTDPNDPASVFQITSTTFNPPFGGSPGYLEMGFDSVVGRFYQVYGSTDLQEWTRVDNGGFIAGDGGPQTLNPDLDPSPSAPRSFLRIHVRADDQFPATVP